MEHKKQMLYPWGNLPCPSRDCHLLFQHWFLSLLRVEGLELRKTQTLPCHGLHAPRSDYQAVSGGFSKE